MQFYQMADWETILRDPFSSEAIGAEHAACKCLRAFRKWLPRDLRHIHNIDVRPAHCILQY